MRAVAWKEARGRGYSPALCVRCDYAQKERIKALGGRWNLQERRWELPWTAEDWQSVAMTIPGVAPDEEVLAELTAAPDDTEREVPQAPPMPLKKGITPYRHQWAAYAQAVSLFEGGEADGPGQRLRAPL